MIMRNRAAAALLLGAAVLAPCIAIAAAAAVCPDIAPAARSFRLEVTPKRFDLPGGKSLAGMAYNNSYIGPMLNVTLGSEVSVDVKNAAPVGTTVHWHGADLPNAAWAGAAPQRGASARRQRQSACPLPPCRHCCTACAPTLHATGPPRMLQTAWMA